MIILLFVQVAATWVEGAFPTGTVSATALFYATTVPFSLALLAGLDSVA